MEEETTDLVVETNHMVVTSTGNIIEIMDRTVVG
jgi:hypothetical protein